MDKKRQEPNINGFIHDYQRDFKTFMDHTNYVTELDFIEMEIEEAKKEIETFKDKLKWIKNNKAIRKFGDENSFENIEYYALWLSHFKKYINWLQEKKNAIESPNRSGGKSFTWNGSQAQKEGLYEALRVAGYIDCIFRPY